MKTYKLKFSKNRGWRKTCSVPDPTDSTGSAGPDYAKLYGQLKSCAIKIRCLKLCRPNIITNFFNYSKALYI